MGALNYNLRKLYHHDPGQRAKVLDSNFSSLEKSQIKREVDLVRELRPNLNRYVYHTSLNFSKAEQLSDNMLIDIAHQYLVANGFDNNQYFIFRHHDAEHPHLHLLVNRIKFDGGVVSDSNNYKKSEQILRSIERQYNLIQLNQSKSSPLRAATKDELEMVVRTGVPSDKMLLQEKLSLILKQDKLSMQDFIQQCQVNGIYLLFNLQSTGRLSGITYCSGTLNIKGQKLGNRFKWAELIKQLNYEQIRDSKAISEANSRTETNDGRFTRSPGEPGIGKGSDRLYWSNTTNFANEHRQQTANEENASEAFSNGERSLETNPDADTLYRDTADIMYRDTFHSSIQIADDVDDDRVFGKERRKHIGR